MDRPGSAPWHRRGGPGGGRGFGLRNRETEEQKPQPPAIHAWPALRYRPHRTILSGFLARVNSPDFAASQAAALGSTVVFGVTVTGTAPTYQWRRNGTALLVGGDAATLTLANVQPDSAGSYDVVVTNGAGTATSAAATLAITQSFAAWTGANGLANGDADPAADPDHDGLPNIVEYALGLDPLVGSTAGLPTLVLEGGRAVFRFTRPTTLTGITYAVQTSGDLVEWVPSASPPVVESATSAVETLTAAFPTEPARFFVRLQVTMP